MKSFPIAHTDITAPAVVLGLMRIPDKTDEEIRELVTVARDLGVDFIDHADVYGHELHHCERRFADAMQLTPSQRDELTLQTKVGIVKSPEGLSYDFSYDHLVGSVEASLRALRTDHVDVLLLHRPDALVEPEEVARAFDELHGSGKVRHFGVSNHTPGQIELLATAVEQPLVINQLQLSIPHAPMISQGIAANMAGQEQSASRDLGMLDFARRRGITVQAWSPYQGGFFTGTFIGDRERYAELNEVLDELADTHGVTPTGIATAWLTRHPAQLQVVLGTTRPGRVAEAVAGAGVELTRPEWYRLVRAAGHTVP
ncbi:aldo/keto reductase [Propionibacteriaceae bacterium Y2011]